MLNQQNHSKKYSLTDIEKYLLGEMSATEMYALEKAALQDPFLAEAIEGYTSTSIDVAKKHIAFFQQKLTALQQRRSKSLTNTFWFKAAASVVFFACLYTISGLLFDEEKKSHKDSAFEKQIMPPSSTITDLYDAPLEEKELIENKDQSPSSTKKYPEIDEQRLSTNKPVIGEQKERGTDIEPTPQQTTDITQTEKGNQSVSTSQPVGLSKVDANNNVNKEIKNADVARNKVVNNTSSPSVNQSQNQSRDYRISSPETRLEIAKIDNESKKKKPKIQEELEGNKPRDYNKKGKEINNSTGDKDEMIVTYGSKKYDSTHNSKEQVIEGYGRSMSQTHPEGGWEKFELYVQNVLQNREKNNDGVILKKNVAIEKKVDVAFSIDNQGRPYNIKIIRSSGMDTYNNTIISIIQKGPRWIIINNNRKIKTTIKL